MDRSLSIIIPAYNEEDNIAATLREVTFGLEGFSAPYEILVVNDCSKDRTAEIVKQWMHSNSHIHLIDNPKNLGFGGAFMAGVHQAKMKNAIMICGDNSTAGSQLRRILAQVGKAEIVICYYPKSYEHSPVRKAISKTYISILNFFCGFNLNYYNAPNVYPTERLKRLSITYGFAYAAQILITLLKGEATFCQVPIVNTARQSGTSKAFQIRNILSVLRTLVYLICKYNRFRKYPEAREVQVELASFEEPAPREMAG